MTFRRTVYWAFILININSNHPSQPSEIFHQAVYILYENRSDILCTYRCKLSRKLWTWYTCLWADSWSYATKTEKGKEEFAPPIVHVEKCVLKCITLKLGCKSRTYERSSYTTCSILEGLRVKSGAGENFCKCVYLYTRTLAWGFADDKTNELV